MPRIRIIDIFIFSLLFVAVVSFPINSLNIPLWSKYVFRIGLSLILLIANFWIIKRYGIRLLGTANKKNLLLMIPFVIILVCNLFTLPFAKNISFNQGNITNGVLFFELALAITQSINEEILFRLFIHSQLPIRNRLLKILASSGIFAAMHLLNFFMSGFNVLALTQIAYAFGLGIVLGLIYEYGKSILTCFVFHVGYNIVNNVIFATMFSVIFEYVWIYYLVIAIITVISVIYGVFIYLFSFKKQENDYLW